MRTGSARAFDPVRGIVATGAGVRAIDRVWPRPGRNGGRGGGRVLESVKGECLGGFAVWKTLLGVIIGAALGGLLGYRGLRNARCGGGGG